MPVYSRIEHDAALGALMEAAAFGASVPDSDAVILNRVCGSHLSGTHESLSFREYEEALARVRDYIRVAQAMNPERAASVMDGYAARAAAAARDRAATAPTDAQYPHRRGSRSQGLSHERRAAERMAILLGLTDRDGNEYGSPSRRQNILQYASET